MTDQPGPRQKLGGITTTVLAHVRHKDLASWMDYALCAAANENPDDWDLDVAGDAERAHAVAVCGQCPVIDRCFDMAQAEPPFRLIQAGYAWRPPSHEPFDAIRLPKAGRPRKRPAAVDRDGRDAAAKAT